MKKNRSLVGKNLAAARKKRGMSQEELARAVQVTRQSISHWENGTSQPDIETLKTLSGILQVSVEELIYGEERTWSRTEMNSAVGRLCRIMAIAVYVMGALAGLEQGSGAKAVGDTVAFAFSFAQACWVWAAAAVAGTVLLGLWRVIVLLEAQESRQNDA